MQERIQLKQEEIVGDQTVLNDIYPKTNTNSIDDTNSGDSLNTTIDRMWNSINNKLSRVVNSVNGRTGVVVLNSEDVGLGNVDNVSLADIKNWVINRMQEEFNVKCIDLYESLDKVDIQLQTWGDDKLYADQPFYAHHGHASKNPDKLDDNRGYIGYIYWDDSEDKLKYTCKVIDTIGHADNSIIYNENVNDVDYTETGAIGVNIWKYEDALEVYNRLGTAKSEGGLRLNKDKLSQRIFYFDGVYGNGEPDDEDALLYWDSSSLPPAEELHQVDIFIDDVEVKSNIASPTGRPYADPSYIRQSFRKYDIIVCHFNDDKYLNRINDSEYVKEGMNPNLVLHSTCIGQVTKIPDDINSKYEIRFYSFEPNLFMGLKEYDITSETHKPDGYPGRKAIGVSLLETKHVKHYIDEETSIKEFNSDYDVNISGINSFTSFSQIYAHNSSAPRSKEFYTITPMGMTSNVFAGDDTRAKESSMYILPNYSLCVIPTWPYYAPEGHPEETCLQNLPVSAPTLPRNYDANLTSQMLDNSMIGINLEKYIGIDKYATSTTPKGWAVNISGLRIDTDVRELHRDWFGGGLDPKFEDGIPNANHSGGLSVNVGDFLEIGASNLSDIYYSEHMTENEYYKDGKVNVRINREKGLDSDGNNRISINISEIKGWHAKNDTLYEQEMIGGGLKFIKSQELVPGQNVNWDAFLKQFDDKSYTKTDSYNTFVNGNNNIFDKLMAEPYALEIQKPVITLRNLLSNEDDALSLKYLVRYATIAKDRYPTPEDLHDARTSFEFCQEVATTVLGLIKNKIDLIIEAIEAYNADKDPSVQIDYEYIQILKGRSTANKSLPLSYEKLKLIIDYIPDGYDVPRITKGIGLNRGIGLRMSHYRSANVWTHTDEPETVAVSIIDSAYTSDAPVQPVKEDRYDNISSETAPTFIPEKYYYKKEEEYKVLEVKPADWNTTYYSYYTQRHIAGAYANINSKEIPIWHVNMYYTRELPDNIYTLQTEPPNDWDTKSYNYYKGEYSQILDAPNFEPYKFYKYDPPTGQYRSVGETKPSDWYRNYWDYYYKEGDNYYRVQSETVPAWPDDWTNDRYYSRAVDPDPTIVYKYTLLAAKPDDWDTASYEYFELNYVALLDPPKFEQNKYYRKNGDTFELLESCPSNWKYSYFAYYEIKDIVDYVKIPQYIAPQFTDEPVYRQLNLDYNKLDYEELNEEPDNWETDYFRYYVQRQKEYTETVINYKQLEISNPAPVYAPNTYYKKSGATYQILTRSTPPDDWDSNYTAYFRKEEKKVTRKEMDTQFVSVPGVEFCPDWQENKYYSLGIKYHPIKEKPSNWDDSWMIYYIKIENYDEPEMAYNMHYDMKGMTDEEVHAMYGGLRYMFTDKGDMSAIGVRISPDKALNGIKTHIGTEALKITDENVLGVQIYEEKNYVNPLEIVSIRKFVEKQYGDMLFLPRTTLIYPDKTGFPEVGDIDRVYIDTQNSVDMIRYVWNPNTNAYEEMLEFYYDKASLPEKGDQNKVYVVGLSDTIELYTWGHPKTVFFPDSTNSDNVSWIDAQEAMNIYSAQSVDRDRSYTKEQRIRLDVDHDGKVTPSDSSNILYFWSLMFKGLYTNDIEGWRQFSIDKLDRKDPNPDAVEYYKLTDLEGFIPGLNLRYEEAAGLTSRISSGNYNFNTGEAAGLGENFYKDALGIKINDRTANTITSITKNSEKPYLLGGLRFGEGGALAVRINDNSYYSVKTGKGKDILTEGSKGLVIDKNNILGVKVDPNKRDLVISNDGYLRISNEFRPEYEWSLSSFIIGNQDSNYVAYNGSQDIKVELGPGLYLSYGDGEEISEQEKVIMNYTEALNSFRDMSLLQTIMAIRYIAINTTLFDDIVNVDKVYFPDFNENNKIDDADIYEMNNIFATIESGESVDPEAFAKADVNHDGVVDGTDIEIVEQFLDSDYNNNASGWYEFSGYELNLWDVEQYYPSNTYDLYDKINLIIQSIRDNFKDSDVLEWIVQAKSYDDSYENEGWRTHIDTLIMNLSRVVSAMSYADLKQFCINNGIPMPTVTSGDDAKQVVDYIMSYKSIPDLVNIYMSIYDRIPESTTSVHKYEMLRQKVSANLNIIQLTQFIRKVLLNKNIVKGMTVIKSDTSIAFPDMNGDGQISQSDINELDNSPLPIPDTLIEKFDIDRDGTVYTLYDREIIYNFIYGVIAEERAKAQLDGKDPKYPNNKTGWKLYLDRECNILYEPEFQVYMDYCESQSTDGFASPGYFAPYSFGDLASMTKACTSAATNDRAYQKILTAYNEAAVINTEGLSSAWKYTLSELATKVKDTVNGYTADKLKTFVEDKYKFNEQSGFPDVGYDTEQHVLAIKSFLVNDLLLVRKKCIPIITLIDICENPV